MAYDDPETNPSQVEDTSTADILVRRFMINTSIKADNSEAKAETLKPDDTSEAAALLRIFSKTTSSKRPS